MNDEIDFNLTPDQWETLKGLRAPTSRLSALNRFVLDDLVALGLAAVSDNMPVITPKGRKVLIRGSSRLWDVAA
jgi:ribosomal protein S19E (S16A)